LLPHTLNPTGTFKDLESAMVTSKCVESGFDRCCTWSTGNAARSYLWYAGIAGLHHVSLIPEQSLYKMAGVASNNQTILLGYKGEVRNLAAFARAYAAKRGLTHLSSSYWRIEGMGVMAYQIAEWVPKTSLIVQTIAGGHGFIGMVHGFRRLMEVGLWRRQMPRFSLFQIGDADTIARALASGGPYPLTAKGLVLSSSPFEPTLQSASAVETYPLVKAGIKQTASSVSAVEPNVIEEFTDELESACKDEGVPVSYEREKSPFISWAGLRLRAREGRVRKDERICFIVTGAPPGFGVPPEPADMVGPHEVED
jgi:threonine synthase